MMRLLKLEGYKLTIEPEILTLKPFSELWKRDKSSTKNKAIQELSYIYFIADPRSDYQYITDEEARKEAIKEGEGMAKDWEPDKILLKAIEFYKSFKPTSALLLEDTRLMVDGYRAKLRSITSNMEELDVKEVKALGDIIKQIPAMVKDLDEAERAVAKEIVQNNKVRGSQEKSMYEDL